MRKRGLLRLDKYNLRTALRSFLQEDIGHDRKSLSFDKRDDYLASHKEDVRRVYEKGGYFYLSELKLAHPRPGAAEWISQHFYRSGLHLGH